ncbi:hypothetical protein T492DRAFT_833900 [Pavlovales sp. CCMP2436]|nr:hypothetical protein T492DRAFT_833900 [Pavlovales sp. CCMP2436]
MFHELLPLQTVLSFQINNNNTGPITLDGGAHAVIQSINVYFGSTHISSIDEYGALFALTQDFTTDLDSLRSSGTVRGIADYLPAAVATAANIKDAYYARNGATIAAGGSLMVALPLMSVLVLSDDIEKAMVESLGGIIQCPTFDYEHYRSTVAPNSGYISAQIPAGMENYRFHVGSTVIPQTAINCTGSAAEARFELARTFGSGVSDAASRSCISAEEYLAGGYAVGLLLQAFPHTDALSDDISTRNMHVVFESKIAANNPTCYLDIWVQLEKIIVCQNGLMTYES